MDLPENNECLINEILKRFKGSDISRNCARLMIRKFRKQKQKLHNKEGKVVLTASGKVAEFLLEASKLVPPLISTVSISNESSKPTLSSFRISDESARPRTIARLDLIGPRYASKHRPYESQRSFNVFTRPRNVFLPKTAPSMSPNPYRLPIFPHAAPIRNCNFLPHDISEARLLDNEKGYYKELAKNLERESVKYSIPMTMSSYYACERYQYPEQYFENDYLGR